MRIKSEGYHLLISFAFFMLFYSSLLPSKALESVISSTYSKSPPTGTPFAILVTFTSKGFSSFARYIAVASPSTFRVGRKNDLLHRAVYAAEQLPNMNILRANARHGRNCSMQHMIHAMEFLRPFIRRHISGVLHHHNHRMVALRVRADGADFLLCQVAADRTVFHLVLRRKNGFGKRRHLLSWQIDDVKCQSLCGFSANPRQCPPSSSMSLVIGLP